MKILIACEESGKVRDAFRAKGHDAISCDILPTRSHPEWHVQGDVSPLFKKKWDMIIAFPPCTHLASSGAAWFAEKRKDGRQQAGIDFFMSCINANASRICVENPVGIMSTHYGKPSQIIHPWQFGHEASKTTCLWLKGLPPLTPTKVVGKGEVVTFKSGKKMPRWYADAWQLPPAERAKIRSATFDGIADAMATQWSNLC